MSHGYSSFETRPAGQGIESPTIPPTETTSLCKEPGPKSFRSECLATSRLGVVSGAGLVADGYDLNVVNLVIAIMHQIYPTKLNPSGKSFVATMTLVGVILGQLVFGSVADIIGRKWSSIVTASLTVLGAVLSACMVDSQTVGIATSLGICRLILGLGIGGEYPLSAAIAKESSNSNLCCTRAQMLVLNITLFTAGGLLQATFVLIMISTDLSLGAVWRLALAGGVVPSLVATGLRIPMHEPEARAAEAPRGEASTPGYFTNLRKELGSRWDVLLGASLVWFFFNITAYGHGAFSSIVCDRLMGATADDSAELVVRRNAVFAMIMNGCSVAGCLSGFYLESRLSRRLLQLIGQFFMALPLWLMGVLFGRVSDSWTWLLVVLYALSSFMVGVVGIVTYLVPSEYTPASVRGTCVGIASASGKIGAVIGTALFPVSEAAFGLNTVLVASAVVSLVGMIVTMAFTPSTKAPEDPRTVRLP